MEIRNLRITKKGKIVGYSILGVLLVLFLTLVIIGTGNLIHRHNYVTVKDGVIAGDIWRVSPQISGTVSEIKVKPGDTVKKGDPVLVLNEDQLRMQINKVAASLQAAKEQFKNAFTQRKKNQLQAADEQFHQARTVYFSAKTAKNNLFGFLNSLQRTYGKVETRMKPYINPATNEYDEGYALQALKFSYNNMPDKIPEYLTKVNTLQQLFSFKSQLALQIVQVRAELNNIKALEASAKSGFYNAKSRINKIGDERSVSEFSFLSSLVDVAQKELNYNKLILDYSIIRAPHGGTVVDVYGHNGEILSPGTSAVTLMDLSQLYAVAYIDQKDLHRVKLGQRVILKLLNGGDNSINGTVSYIGNVTQGIYQLITGNHYSSDRIGLGTKIPVKINIKQCKFKIIPGMTVRADIRVTK